VREDVLRIADALPIGVGRARVSGNVERLLRVEARLVDSNRERLESSLGGIDIPELIVMHVRARCSQQGDREQRRAHWKVRRPGHASCYGLAARRLPLSLRFRYVNAGKRREREVRFTVARTRRERARRTRKKG
jgi:hypothetical protein